MAEAEEWLMLFQQLEEMERGERMSSKCGETRCREGGLENIAGEPGVRYYALTYYLHVEKLIGSDCPAFGIDCTVYLCNVSFRYVRVQA